MNEKLLHYIWKHQLFDKRKLQAIDGESLVVESCGQHNPDSGPDFINARVRIGETLWVGNIEVHLTSSDWYNHNHHTDRAYNNVILHVVNEHDRDIHYTNGEKIPTLELKTGKSLLENFKTLMRSETWIPCQSRIQAVDPFYINSWLGSLAFERLQQKSQNIMSLFSYTQNDWEQTLFIALSGSFGAKINTEPFERLAKSIPIGLISKYKFNSKQVEALFFGQAGFLNDDTANSDDYYQSLKTEYDFLRKKHSFTFIEQHNWKFLRVRPSGFPTIRIAQLAALYIKYNTLFSRIVDHPDLKEYYHMFTNSIPDYWLNHFLFGKETEKASRRMTQSTIDILLINAVLPVVFTYGRYKGLPQLQDKALELFEKLKPEANIIIRKWEELQIKADNALQSQALLQLKNGYCNHKRCLECPVGLKVLI
jgi:hypothetical protein